MEDHHTFDPPLRFAPDYVWPEEGTEKNCPRCGNILTLNENKIGYMGKPWWCGTCRWQFTDEEVR